MDQNPQPQPQNPQVESTTKKGFSLTLSIIITTVLVILGFMAEIFIMASIETARNSYSLAILGVFLWDVVVGIPLMIISIILIIIDHSKLKSNPNVSRRIAIFYLITPIICLILYIPALLSNFQNIIFFVIFLPLLIYDWIFIKIYLEAKKSIEQAVQTQVSAGKVRKHNDFTIFAILNSLIIYIFEIIVFNVSIPHSGYGNNYHINVFNNLVGSSGLLILSSVGIFFLNRADLILLRQIRRILLFSLLITIPNFAFRVFVAMFCENCEIVNPITIIFLLLPPWTLFTILFTIPKQIRNRLDPSLTRSNSEFSPAPLPESHTNSDPRFPTLDAQTKPQNTPPDNKKQG